MTIIFNCAFLNCTCVSKFGTAIIVKNCFWLKSKHSCKSAIYYNLSKEVINEYCTFRYFYNTTVMPSVLDGGPQILLANILTPKRLICTYAYDMAHPVPSHDYVLVNRSMLCNCHMESGLTYLLKSIAFCETASADYTMSFALNLAFLHMIQDLWLGNFSNSCLL